VVTAGGKGSSLGRKPRKKIEILFISRILDDGILNFRKSWEQKCVFVSITADPLFTSIEKPAIFKIMKDPLVKNSVVG